MTTGLELVQAGKVFEGQPYSTGNLRTSPDSDYKDCSGFVYATHLVATGQPFPDRATVSTAQEIACGGRGGGEGGTFLTRDQAAVTPGAICFIWGYSAGGHVELVSDREGFTYGTPSDIRDPQSHDVGYTPFSGNAWERFMLIPGITYDSSEEDPLAKYEPSDLVKFAEWAEKNVSEGVGVDGQGPRLTQIDNVKEGVLIALRSKEGKAAIREAMKDA